MHFWSKCILLFKHSLRTKPTIKSCTLKPWQNQYKAGTHQITDKKHSEVEKDKFRTQEEFRMMEFLTNQGFKLVYVANRERASQYVSLTKNGQFVIGRIGSRAARPHEKGCLQISTWIGRLVRDLVNEMLEKTVETTRKLVLFIVMSNYNQSNKLRGHSHKE